MPSFADSIRKGFTPGRLIMVAALIAVPAGYMYLLKPECTGAS